MCLYSRDYNINHNEKEYKNEIKITNTTKIDLGLEMDTNIINIKSAQV